MPWSSIWSEEDLERGDGEVYVPEALERKYPRASEEWDC